MAAVAAIGGLAIAGISAYSQNQASQQANATAQKQVAATEQGEQQQDEALTTQQAQNTAAQTQDAQWMQMRTFANSMQGLSSTPPGALGAQSGALGASAMSKAGKI